jgi:hypothetical protein
LYGNEVVELGLLDKVAVGIWERRGGSERYWWVYENFYYKVPLGIVSFNATQVALRKTY